MKKTPSRRGGACPRPQFSLECKNLFLRIWSTKACRSEAEIPLSGAFAILMSAKTYFCDFDWSAKIYFCYFKNVEHFYVGARKHPHYEIWQINKKSKLQSL
jgi:hypothetical protein